MAMYDFKCESCAHEFEAIMPYGWKGPYTQCPECDEFNAFRVNTVNKTSFKLVGGGWYSDLYSSTKTR